VPRFRPGQSGNPSGRPKSAAGLRELLLAEYGDDAGVLVQRLERISTGRNARLALEATELLMAYHAGKPINAVALDIFGSVQHAHFQPVAATRLAQMTEEELHVLEKLNRRDASLDG